MSKQNTKPNLENSIFRHHGIGLKKILLKHKNFTDEVLDKIETFGGLGDASGTSSTPPWTYPTLKIAV